jgi:hypothetical protein
MTPSTYALGIDPWAVRLPMPVEFGRGSLKRCVEYLPDIERVLVVTGKRLDARQ